MTYNYLYLAFIYFFIIATLFRTIVNVIIYCILQCDIISYHLSYLTVCVLKLQMSFLYIYSSCIFRNCNFTSHNYNFVFHTVTIYIYN